MQSNNTERRTEKGHLRSRQFGGMTDPRSNETERKEVPMAARVRKRQIASASGAKVTVSLLFRPPFPHLTLL